MNFIYILRFRVGTGCMRPVNNFLNQVFNQVFLCLKSHFNKELEA